ncbi:MAG TPA: pitrilysin family protein, partial [Isosphaeraceae bacterium]
MIPRLAPLLVLFVPLVASATDPGIPDLPHEAYRLPNGLKVVLHRDPAVPRVTVCVAYHVGSKNERAGRTGFAHFFEHMMFRGTPHVPNYDIPLQEAGAQSNAFTTEDMTIYFETVPSDYLERALYLEAERLAFLPAALDREKFDTEREVVKNERRQAIENVPYGTAEETLLAHVFPPGQPYSWPVIGSMRDLDAATPEDLKRFFAEFYHPGNATVCLAGDFDPDQAKGWIATYFGPLAAGPAVRPVEAPRRTIEAVERIRTDDVQLPRVYWAWPTVADDHPDAPALHLLAAVLADGQASRLYRALVRDARIAQDVAAASDTKEAAGLFTLQATAAPGKGSEEIGRVFAAELERVRAAAPTAEELARARAKFEKGVYTAPVTGLVSPLGRAIVLATGFAQKDDPGYYRRDIDRYFRVTPADLGRVAGAYLTPAKVTLLVRPGEPEAEAPGAGPAAGAAPGPALPERTPAPGPDWARLPGPA